MAEIIDPLTIENPVPDPATDPVVNIDPLPDPVPDPVPNPILGLIKKRKIAKERKMGIATLGKNAMSMAPGYVPRLNADEEVNSQFEIDELDNQIKGIGYDPDKTESLIGDLPDNTPEHLVNDLFQIKSPYDIKRKKAAIKWQATTANYIGQIADPASKQSAMQSFDNLVMSRGGYEGKPYAQNIAETEGAITMIKNIPGISDDDARNILSNLRYDTEQGSADLLLRDPEAQNRWNALGLNPLQGLALDMDRMFGHGDRKTGQLVPGTEYEKRLLAKYTDPNAQGEQNIQLAELENQGIEILGEYLESRLKNGASKADVSNKLYTDSQPILAELKKKIDSDDKIGAEVKAKLATFQDQYKQAMDGTVNGVFTSPFEFEDLKAKVADNSASATEIREFNKRVERINQVAGDYNQTLKEVNTLVGSQSAAVREYNKIIGDIQESTNGLQGLDNLGKWSNYMAEIKNSQAKRYPQTRAIQTEEVLQDLVGANAGGIKRFIYGVASAAGGSVVDATQKIYNNLTMSGDDLRQADMSGAFSRRVEDVALNYVTSNQSLYERQVIPTINKDLQKTLDDIKANPSLSSEDKYKQSYKIIEDGFASNQINYVANPRYGKLNLQSAAITNTIATVSSQFIGQMLMSAATGGLGNVSKARSLATLFGTTAAQVFPREYDAAIQSGQDNPFVYGLTKAIASGLSELPFDNLAFLKNIKPGSLAGKIATGLSEAQFNMLTSGRALGAIAPALGGAAEMIVKEGGLEEGLDQVFGNVVDNKFNETNKNILDGVEHAMLSGIIGTAPLAIIGLPLKARTTSLQNKLMIYQAGYKADKVIESINQQLGDGTLTQQEATERIQAVSKMKKIVDGMSMYDANGKPLSDIKKAEFVWNQYVQDLAKSGVKTVPTQQQAELNTLIEETDQNNSNILNGEEDATQPVTGQIVEAQAPTGQVVDPTGQVTIDPVAQLREEEQSELDSKIANAEQYRVDGKVDRAKLTNQEDIKAFDEVYEKYDKLISPLLREQQASPTEAAGQTAMPTIGFTDINGQEVTIDNVDQATDVDDVQKTVLQNSIMAAKSLLSGGVSFRVFQNQADFENAASQLGQNAKGQGAFISDGKAVLINLSKIKTPQDWGIVWHEAAHPVLNIIRNTDPELYGKMAKGFGGLAQQADSPFAQIQAWAQADYGNKPGEEQTDEAMTETVSAIGTGAIKLQDIPTGFRQTVIDFINGVADYLGLGQLSDTSERVFIQKANQIAQALTSGTDISEVVGQENVGQSQNLFVQEKKDGVKAEATEKEAAQAVKMYKEVVKEQKATPEAVIAEPQRNKDGSIKFDVIVDEDGKRSIDIKYKGEPYALKNGALENINKNEQKAIEKLSDKIVEDYNANKEIPEIAAGIGWYSKMRERFQQYFGANIETFGQLLAATSARTGVFDNFKQAVDAFTNLSKGKYNVLMEDYDKYVKGIMGKTDAELETQWKSENPKKRISEFNTNDYKRMLVNRYENVPLRSNGKKFNANSPKVLQALYGNWLDQTEGPKTKNFAGNLTGRSFAPTIDVWAARYLRRTIYEGKQKRWRIPPSMEKGVDFGILVSGEMTGDYPFAEKVMQSAADKLGINADDLQAFLWYLEKDVWDKNNWTNKSGAEKASFEQGADTIANTERYQAGVTTYRDAATFDPVKFEEERKALEAAIANTPGVIASRVNASTGEFAPNDANIISEPTFDMEFTVAAGTDVTAIRKKVEQILKDYEQDSTLFSKVVNKNHPNARPMIEIGLSSPAMESPIIEDIKAMLVESNVRGFTVAKDSRNKILGLRAQFVPEFEDGTTMNEGVDRFTAAVDKLKGKYGKDTNISYIASGFVDTDVKFKEDGKQTEQLGTTGDEVGSIPQPSSGAGSGTGQISGNTSAATGTTTEPIRGAESEGSGGAGTVGQEQAPNLAQERISSPIIDGINNAIQERNSAAKIVSKIKDNAINRMVKLGYGYLPENVRGAMAKKTRMIDADLNEMNVTSKRFEDAIKEAYGVKYKNLDDDKKALLDSALRNFEGTVDLNEIDRLRSQIPDSVLEHIDNMRLKVDVMSKRMTDLGLLDGNLEPVIDGDKGLGVYLTRSYRKYDTKDYVTNIPEDVRNRAFQFLKANNRVTEFDAAGIATDRELTDEEVDGLVNYIATNMDPVMEGLNAANTGRVKVDILKSRKVIPEEIRDLMGEYKDPIVNFSKTIAKMSTLITTHETLTQIRDENMGKIFFDKPTGKHFVPVAGKDAKFLQPLAGLYTTPEIADAFKEVQSTLDGEDFNVLALRAIASINGFAKVGKTALSPASWVRNVIGGHIIMIKDGHLFGGAGYTKGWKGALGYFLDKSKDDAGFQSYMRELIENGIIGEGVSAGEFKAIVQAASKSDNPLDYIKNDSKLGRFVQGVKGFYSAQDDIFRIWAYENEKDRLTKRKKNMTEDEIKLEAAKKARATYPTYSELPNIVRQLAKFIPISSFPAFSAELIRTTKNSIKIGLEELADPDMRDVGAKRLAGTIAAISFGAIVSGASQMMAGVDDEEENAIKRFMPEWSRNSNLVFLGRDENDLPKYVDLGFSDPYSYFRKPFVALSGDAKLSNRMKEASREVLAPFVAPEIFLSALIKGNKKVNESDDLEEVLGKYAGPVYEALEPGAIASARRILKGATGEVDSFGQKYDLTLESLAFVTGQRMKSLDVPVSLGFKGRDFMKRRTELQDEYRTERSKTTSNPDKVQAELDEASEKFKVFYDEFQKDYDAALYLMTRTVPVRQARRTIDAILKDRGVTEMYRTAIKKHKPYPGINDEDKQSGQGSN